jgi:capsule polysaccharide export protein KpsE/RkpR
VIIENRYILKILFLFVECYSVNRISVDKYERNSVLTVRKAVRADSGKYKIILKNSSGTCEGVADVVVLGEYNLIRRRTTDCFK